MTLYVATPYRHPRKEVVREERSRRTRLSDTRFDRDHGVDEAVFERVKQRFGERGLVDLTGLIGYYSFVSVTLNVFEVPVPPGAALLPK
jgi:hypothetical protein